MNPMPVLSPHLKQLRLSGILDSLEARNRQAIESKLAYTEFLAMLVSDEIARRENKKFSMRLRRAQFRTSNTLEQFDFQRLATSTARFDTWLRARRHFDRGMPRRGELPSSARYL